MPVVTDDIPIDHRYVPPCRRGCQTVGSAPRAGVIGQCGADGEYDPEDHSCKDSHGLSPSLRHPTQLPTNEFHPPSSIGASQRSKESPKSWGQNAFGAHTRQREHSGGPRPATLERRQAAGRAASADVLRSSSSTCRMSPIVAPKDLDLHQPRIPSGFGRVLTQRAISNSADRICVDRLCRLRPLICRKAFYNRW